MRKHIQIIMSLFFVTLLNSCGNESHHNHANYETQSTKESDAHAVHEAGRLSLYLDGGHKWQMDDHTRLMFKKISNTFRSLDRSSLPAIRKSGQDIQNHITELIKGCTMTGEGHEQLHVFLSAFIPAIQKLSSVSDLQTGQQTADAISDMLRQYTDYFE